MTALRRASQALSPQDQAWLVAAHPGDPAEIAVNEAAVDNAITHAVHAPRQTLIDDQTMLDAVDDEPGHAPEGILWCETPSVSEEVRDRWIRQNC